MRTTPRTYTLTDDTVDLIPTDLLIAILGLDLHAMATYGSMVRPHALHTATWTDRDGTQWDLPTYGYVVGTRTILWTVADGAGVQDVRIAEDDDVVTDVREYAEALAADLDLRVTR